MFRALLAHPQEALHKWQTEQPYFLIDMTSNFFVNNTIYLLTVIGLTPGGSSTVHIYTQTVHRTTQ
jgi:hypothetical protein